MLSVLETPLSLAAWRSGALGTSGAAVSMVTITASLSSETLPAASTAWTVIDWAPAARGGGVGGPGAVGPSGAAVSMVTDKSALAVEMLPAASTAWTVIAWAPSARAEVVWE